MTSLNRSQSLENKPKYNLEAFINKKASYNLSNITILQHKIEEAEKESAFYFEQVNRIRRQIECIQQKLTNIRDYKEENQNEIQNILKFNDNIINILTSKNLPNCSICLTNIPTNNVAITKCSHMFCKICLSQSIRWSDRCPICRKNINIHQVCIVNLDDNISNSNSNFDNDEKEDISNISQEHNDDEEKVEEIEEEKREDIPSSENLIRQDYINEYRIRGNFIIPPHQSSRIRTYNYDIQGRRRGDNDQGNITRYNTLLFDDDYYNELYNSNEIHEIRELGRSYNPDRNLGGGGGGGGGERGGRGERGDRIGINSIYLRNPRIDAFRRNRRQNESSIVPSETGYTIK